MSGIEVLSSPERRRALWGAVNAVTYYVDHVRSGGAGERLDSAWFGAGSVLKDRAWAAACDLVDQPAGTL
jgi:hypothetical protein